MERDVGAQILATIGALPNVRLWRNNTGVGRSMDGERVIRYGAPGGSDYIGLVAPSGRLLAVEVKTLVGRQSEQQRRFQSMVEGMGGIYVLARSVDDVTKRLTLEGVM